MTKLYPALRIEQLEEELSGLLDARAQIDVERSELTQEIISTTFELRELRRYDAENNPPPQWNHEQENDHANPLQ